MRRRGRLAIAAACIGGVLAGAPACLGETLGSGLIGAWTTNLPDCKRLFTRRGGQLVYRQPVDKFAQAAIIEPQAIHLPASICHIQHSSRAGDTVKISAECRDSISYTSQSVQIKIRSGSEIVYSPTGDPILDTIFIKCPL